MMKKLTLQDMTESEQREVKTELDRARKNHGRTLTNSEQNKVKNEAIERVMAAREKIAKATRTERKQTAPNPQAKHLAGLRLSAPDHIVKTSHPT